MQFNLFYKQYDCKLSLSAIKSFEESTGKSLLGTLTDLMLCSITCKHEGVSVMETVVRLSNIVTETQAAQIFYCLAKQSNKALTIDEIEDAVFHAGVIPSTDDNDDREPYPAVLCKLAVDANEYHNSIAKEKKLSARS